MKDKIQLFIEIIWTKIKRIFSPDFYVCEYVSDSWLDKGVATNKQGNCVVFGNGIDEALKDADQLIYKIVKLPSELKEIINVVIKVRKPTVRERMNATGYSLRKRVVL